MTPTTGGMAMRRGQWVAVSTGRHDLKVAVYIPF
jgi:hypothetical protein